jgi:hypothetical protein
MTNPEVITAAKDCVLAFAALATSIIAGIGLQTWNRQLKGTANFEVARSLAKATYKLRDDLRMCRSPFISTSEFPAGYNSLRSDAQETAAAYGHVYSNRWKPVFTALQEFDAQTLEGEALWGGKIRETTDQLRKVVRQLNAALDAFISDKASGGRDFESDRNFGVKIRSEISASDSDEKNLLNISTSSAISAIESELRPHLKRA